VARPTRLAAVLVGVVGLALVTASCGNTVTDPVSSAPSEGAIVTVEIVPPDEATAATDATPSSPPAPLSARSTYTVVAQATVPDVVVRSGPGADTEPVAALVNPTASGSPLVFRAVEDGATSADWIEVYLPIRPNGSSGWVLRSEVVLSDNPYRVEIDRATYSLRVYNLEDLWLETTIAVGNGDTPTPVGDFYLMELLAPPNPNGPYGPFAFGLSGFSEVLSEFGGADEAIIGLHGTNDPSALGTDVSFGCIRLENAIIESLARTLPLGTPVAIT